MERMVSKLFASSGHRHGKVETQVLLNNEAEVALSMSRYILVHGSFHGPWCWDDLIPQLPAADSVVCVDLGSDDHGDHVGRLTAELGQSAGHRIVLIVHSYAGMLAADAIVASSVTPHRTIFVDAFVPWAGETALDYLHSIGADLPIDAEEMLVPPNPTMLLDTEAMDRADWLAGRLQPFPAATHRAASANDASAIPDAAYIRCERFALFQGAEDRARAAGWTVEKIDAGHDAMLTRPTDLALVIARLSQ
jgi:hypothetical protein